MAEGAWRRMHVTPALAAWPILDIAVREHQQVPYAAAALKLAPSWLPTSLTDRLCRVSSGFGARSVLYSACSAL